MAVQRTRNCDDDAWEDDDTVVPIVGAAETASGPSSEYPVAVLWLPDPEARLA